MALRLNLGCGVNLREGFVNVDKLPQPGAQQVDLEAFPWPWETSSVEEVMLNHVMEHMGQLPDVFIGVMKELYRVSAPNAKIQVNVPHPRHDTFIGDPTHVRPILPVMFTLFSKRLNRQWQEMRAANSLFGLWHDVDFELTHTVNILDPKFQHLQGTPELDNAMRTLNGVIKEIRMTLRVVKDVPAPQS